MQKIYKTILSVILGTLISLNRQYGALTGLVIVIVIIDVILGFIEAKIHGHIDVYKGMKVFWNKIALLAGLFFGYFLDVFERYILHLASESNIVVLVNVPFSKIIGIYLILNEGIAICEKLISCGVKLPTFIIKALKKASKEMDEKTIK